MYVACIEIAPYYWLSVLVQTYIKKKNVTPENVSHYKTYNFLFRFKFTIVYFFMGLCFCVFKWCSLPVGKRGERSWCSSHTAPSLQLKIPTSSTLSFLLRLLQASHHNRSQCCLVNLDLHSCCYPSVTHHPWHLPSHTGCSTASSSDVHCLFYMVDPSHINWSTSTAVPPPLPPSHSHTSSILLLLTFIPLHFGADLLLLPRLSPTCSSLSPQITKPSVNIIVHGDSRPTIIDEVGQESRCGGIHPTVVSSELNALNKKLAELALYSVSVYKRTGGSGRWFSISTLARSGL